MDVSSPISSVVPGVGGLVLAILSRTTQPLTGRRIAAMLAPAASQSGVNDALRDLVRHGLVLREHAGSAYLHRLNRNHLAAPAVVALASLRQSLLDAIAHHVAGWEAPAQAVWLFGSTARGDGHVGSDVDLLVVRPVDVDEADPCWEAQLSDLTEAVHVWTGNPAEILEHDATSLGALVASGDALIDDLIRDVLVITGPSPTMLLRTARAA